MKTRQGSKIQSKLVVLIYGDTFTGKTTLGLQLADLVREDGKPMRVAVVDAEGGGVDDAIAQMEDRGVNIENIQIFYTQSLMELKGILEKIKNKGEFYHYNEDGTEDFENPMLDADGEPFFPDAILVDGTSIFKLTSEQGLLELSKKRNTIKADKDGLLGDARFVKIQGADLEFKDYKKLNFSGQNLILDLMALGIHVVVTAREADEKVQIKGEDGKATSVSTGRKIPDGFKGIEYNVKTVLRTFLDKETGQICMHVNKDRTKVHAQGEIIEDPTLLDYQEVINKNVGKKRFILQNDLDKAVETEQKMYEKEAMELLEKVTTSSTAPAKSENDNTEYIESMKQEINAKRNALNPQQKIAMKNKLTQLGLPLSYAKVTDASVLEKVIMAFDEI